MCIRDRSEIIPTRDGYTFMGWANSRTGKPIYGGSGGYTSCLVVHGYDMSTTLYAIWEVHNHSWGEWTSNGNGTHTCLLYTSRCVSETDLKLCFVGIGQLFPPVGNAFLLGQSNHPVSYTHLIGRRRLDATLKVTYPFSGTCCSVCAPVLSS